MARIKRGSMVASMLMLVVIITSACNQPYSQQPSVTNTPIDTSLFATPPPEHHQMMMWKFLQQGRKPHCRRLHQRQRYLLSLANASSQRNFHTHYRYYISRNFSNCHFGCERYINYSIARRSQASNYTLQNGEFVFCIARRFNVDPDEILALNGLFDSQTVYPGLVLKIPQSGKAFQATEC